MSPHERAAMPINLRLDPHTIARLDAIQPPAWEAWRWTRSDAIRAAIKAGLDVLEKAAAAKPPAADPRQLAIPGAEPSKPAAAAKPSKPPAAKPSKAKPAAKRKPSRR